MKIVSIGGGPAGLYLAILMKKADPAHDITIVERNKPGDTFGFGVVFSDETLGNFADADRESYDAITAAFAHWTDIDVHYQGQVVTSKGHGFSGMARVKLLDILAKRAAELGVKIVHERDVKDVTEFPDADLILAADGVNSAIRAKYEAKFKPSLDWRRNKFVWLGTTRPHPAFTFHFKEHESGLYRVHAYQYDATNSTFIVETSETAWKKAGLDKATEEQTIDFCEKLFAEELAGHKLIANRSIWRTFPTIRNAHWSFDNVVLMGDACHTAHFSIGSGTKLAMEDAIELAAALKSTKSVKEALAAYEAKRKPQTESIQRAAQTSLEWFEETERYIGKLDALEFAFAMLTRSMRITHANLKLRDPALVAKIDQDFAAKASVKGAPPPMFTPYKIGQMEVPNRIVVSPMCQYSAEDGLPNDWHLVHLGSRALGGAGLILTEMTDVSAEGRITPGCAGLYKDEHVAAWKRVTEFVHASSPAKIGVQLAHAGRKGSTKRAWEGIDQPLPDGNWELIAPSPLPYKKGSQTPRAMTRTDMDKVKADFVAATKRADAAGFDIVEVHMAHGYLLASFVSPLTNQRSDEYGGSLEKRLRFPLEVLDAVRATWPKAKPIAVRISATDWKEGGTTPDEAVAIAKMLKAHGADIVDVSAGQTVDDDHPVYGRLFQTPFADRIRQEADVPVMTVGAISTWADANTILAARRADLCVLARAHLYDPYWTRHAAQEQGYDLPWPPQYGSARSFTPRPSR